MIDRNSSKNKYNPDPTQVVRFGDPTYAVVTAAAVLLGAGGFVTFSIIVGVICVYWAFWAAF